MEIQLAQKVPGQFTELCGLRAYNASVEKFKDQNFHQQTADQKFKVTSNSHHLPNVLIRTRRYNVQKSFVPLNKTTSSYSQPLVEKSSLSSSCHHLLQL